MVWNGGKNVQAKKVWNAAQKEVEKVINYFEFKVKGTGVNLYPRLKSYQ